MFLRKSFFILLLSGLMAFPPLPGGSLEPAGPETRFRRLLDAAPRVQPAALRTALTALDSLRNSGAPVRSALLVLIDYSRPSTEPRLWTFDLERNRLLFEELVAHGKNSGQNLAVRFSNQPGSRMSSLGLFVTAGSYYGRNGYSLRLEGLEPGINDRAMERAIVVHGAGYVNSQLGRRMGRIGRSWGCPAVRTAAARPLIDTIRGGAPVFAYYPQPEWLRGSKFLRSGPAVQAAGLQSPGRGASGS